MSARKQVMIPNGSSFDPKNGVHKMDARAIVVNYTNMSARPEFYSGRGAKSCDLNGDQLYEIYKGVVEHQGQEAGDNFVQIVEDLQELSATAFLQTFYDLEYNRWDARAVHPSDGVAHDGLRDGGVTAMGTILSAFAFGSGYDETETIRGNFLYRLGKSGKRCKYDNNTIYFAN